MDLVRGGQLSDHIDKIKKSGVKYPDSSCASIMKGIISAVSYIHSKGIVHRDLKPENILIQNPNDPNSIKVIDFGLSAKFDQNSLSLLDARCGTLIFMAPEIIQKHEYSKSVDIWSIGIIMYILISGGDHPLYNDTDTKEQFKARLQHETSITYTKEFSNLA